MITNLLRNGKVLFLLTLIAYAFLFVTNGVPYIYADGFYYYHIARSIITQGSFVSSEKPEYYDYSAYAVAEYGDKYVEVVTPGTSLLLLPGLSVSSFFRSPLQTVQNEYFLAFNGHTLADGIALLLTAVVFSLASVVLLYQAMLKLGYTRAVAAAATIAGYLSSFAIWYVFLEPAYSHIYEFFAVSLLLFGLAGYFQFFEKNYLYASGVALGLLFLIRPPYALVAIAVGLVFLWRRNWSDLVRLVGSSLPFLLVWFVYNFISYGSILTTGYTQIRGETFVPQFNLVPLLFSLERGWFVYSPLMLIGIIGLILWWKRSAMFAFIFTASTAALVLTYSFWGAWWGGYGFGQRFLLGVTPFVVLGVAEVLNYVKKWPLRNLVFSCLAVLVLWSLSLTVLYRFTPVTQLKTEGEGSMQAVDRYTPLDMWQYHIELIKNAPHVDAYLEKLIRGANGGESLLVYMLGWSDRVIRLDAGQNEGEILLSQVIPQVWTGFEREKTATGFMTWNEKVYFFEVPLSEFNKQVILQCDQTCGSSEEKVVVKEVQDYPNSLSEKNFSCFEMSVGQRICVRKLRGNTVKGPKTNYSKQSQFVLAS